MQMHKSRCKLITFASNLLYRHCECASSKCVRDMKLLEIEVRLYLALFT